MSRILITALLFIFLGIYSAFAQTGKVNESDLKKLAAWMSGKFSSEAQSVSDTNFLHISLIMEPIWTERNDGYWLYVEQALASRKEQPYRQRIYHLYLLDEYTIVSKVYELPEPELFIGAWTEKEKFNSLTTGDLVDRQGCSIFLNKIGKRKFSGSTPGKECLSRLRGATYATSEVTITPKQLISWDRGWNENDEQVWGSVGSGYIFDKVNK